MTLLQEIQSAQSLLLPPYASKRLLIYTPLSVIAALNPLKQQLWIFDPTHYMSNDTDDYVYLTLFPTYTPEDEILGQRGYKNTFNRSAIAPPSTVRRGFTAVVKQPQRMIFDIIQRVAKISNTSSFTTHTPVKVIDFSRPEAAENANNIIANSEIATIRWGKIDIAKPPSFVRSSDIEYCLENWEFKFSESILRQE